MNRATAVRNFLLAASVVLMLAIASVAQITPKDDTYTVPGSSTVEGAATTLSVTGSATAATNIAYIRFDVQSVPAGATISQATLKLYVNAVTTAGSFYVEPVVDSGDNCNTMWKEATLTGATTPQPCLGASIAGPIALTTASGATTPGKNQYILIPITPMVQDWINGQPNYGIALVADASAGAFSATFDSKESTTTSHPPELDIAYEGGSTSGITGVTTASGSGLMGGGTSGTLNMSLDACTSAGQVLEWNGSAWACSAVGTGTISGSGDGGVGGGYLPEFVSVNAIQSSDVWQASNGSIGIATNAPAYTLHVVDSGAGTSAIAGISSSVGHAGVLGVNSANSGSGTNGGYFATSSPNGAAVAAFNNSTSSGPNLAGYFYGNVDIIGTLSINNSLFDWGNYASYDSYMGFAGNNSSSNTGSGNTGAGYQALAANTAGYDNTAFGDSALSSNTIGILNTAVGNFALNNNATGQANTATGLNALGRNTGDTSGNGSFNTAAGVAALFNNTTGNYNTATGADALYSNTTSSSNTAAGTFALFYNTTGTGNTADGYFSLNLNSTGNYNTGLGWEAMYTNNNGTLNTGSYDTAIGGLAGDTADGSPITGSSNTFLGYQSAMGTGTYNYATAIGVDAEVDQSYSLVLGSVLGTAFCSASGNPPCANASVGIGTTAPAATLDVEAPVNSPGPTVNFGNKSNTATVNIIGTLNLNGTAITPGGGGSGGGVTSVTSSDATVSVTPPTGTGAVNLSIQSTVNAVNSALTAAGNAATAAANAQTTANNDLPLAGGTMTGALSIPANNLAVGGTQLVLTGGNVGIGTDTPGATLDVEASSGSPTVNFGSSSNPATFTVNGATSLSGSVQVQPTGTATSSTGYNSNSLGLTASSYNGSAAVSQQFVWQAQPTGNGTSGASGQLSLLFGSGTATPAATGLSINNLGIITFASGQTFGSGGGGGGSGTVTSVATGQGLTGGPITTSGTISIPNSGVTNSMLANSYITIATAGGLTGCGTISLGSSCTLTFTGSNFAQLNAANTFTALQTITSGGLNITGVLGVSGGITGGSLNISGGGAITTTGAIEGGAITGSSFNGIAMSDLPSSSDNVFVGVTPGASAGSSQTAVGVSALASTNAPGSADNTAVGFKALTATTSGTNNTAVGYEAGDTNASGQGNTAVGVIALYSNSSGSYNTALGYNAGPAATSTGLSYATVIGAGAEVNEGSTSPANSYDTAIGAGALVNVGSGSTGPTYATAVGAGAMVNESNALVLGNVVGANGCSLSSTPACNNTMVGIGTTAPAATLDVEVPSGTTTGGPTINFGNSTNTATVTVNGTLTVTGNLNKPSGNFQIDHPLDPANKYLYHSFVESPDMMNVYNGNVTTDENGLTVVVLPDYFEALNRDFRYQLTVIGQFAQAIVLKKVVNNRFVIQTDKPGVEVSWQVTGIRQDAYANAHRIAVEVDKPEGERGRYLHPELFGAGPEQAVGYRSSEANPR